MVTDPQTRERLQDIVRAADPGARVHRRWVGDIDETKWAAKLRPTSGPKEGLIFAVVISPRVPLQQERKSHAGGGTGLIKTGRIYRITFYEGYRDNGDADNSEDSISLRVATVAEAISRKPHLDFTAANDRVMSHGEMQGGLQATIPFGNELVTVVYCSLAVNLNNLLT